MKRLTQNADFVHEGSTHSFTAASNQAPIRLDQYLSEQFSRYSRSFLQKIIMGGHVHINNIITHKPKTIIKPFDIVSITFPTKEKVTTQDIIDTDIGIKIVHEDPHFLILYKPPHILVHRAHNADTQITVVEWLLAHYHNIADVGYIDRPGIVHRLDKDTSGLLIVTRTNYAHSQFTQLFKNRKIEKTYYAIVHGHPPQTGTINMPIGRHPTIRTRMKAFKPHETGNKTRHAITHYSVEQYYDDYALVKVKPVTGRTHQIRVHLAAIGHHIVGDAVYGSRSPLIKRHALHASELSFIFDKKTHNYHEKMPLDMLQLLSQLNPLPA